MTTLQIIVLAVVQGITEFLPISSSGHLILVPHVFEWPDQGLIVDVAVHVGSLVAVLLFFWRDVLSMIVGIPKLVTDRRHDGAKLIIVLLAGTVPIILVGIFAKDLISASLRSMELIAWTTTIGAILLYLADRFGMMVRRLEHMTVGSAFLIGCAQVIALLPGTSRSGITITMGRFLGFDRREAARFSFLLSIPTISAAGILGIRDLMKTGDTQLQHDALMAGILACLTALGAIWFLMFLLKRTNYTPFVIYRLLLGATLFVWVYWIN
ncbi:MAG: undecaprenyl-diphosphate phosphatase [Alphaproteobacteria bacterium]|nr:undecaprenyl-diphosphate phosphatase [Alphaproteobacteria bacterium]